MVFSPATGAADSQHGVCHWSLRGPCTQLPNYFEDNGCFVYEDLDGGIHDAPDATIAPYLDRAADFIARALALGGGVYVHCIAGMSRSVTIVLAYLVKHGGMTLREAYVLHVAPTPNASLFAAAVCRLRISLCC